MTTSAAEHPPARRPLPALSIRGDNVDLAAAPPGMPAGTAVLSIYNGTAQASILLDSTARRALADALDAFDHEPRLTVAPASLGKPLRSTP